jgi:hypothetical protein
MKSLLSSFVRANFGDVMSIKEAEQLAFTIFCTLDYFPEVLKKVVWDRARIASEFVALKKEGFLPDASAAHEDAAYWSAAIDRFIAKEIEVDWSLRAGLKS